ncbi:uncharacterized protein [Palaemon carinicauda]|uniref:uncharacterized protein isoform X2 n=1 Tax=Palaemon carinicauda TaxID=392227 RepID=UPI0035B5EEF7
MDNQQSVDSQGPSGGRRRIRNEENWIPNTQKRKRNSGQADQSAEEKCDADSTMDSGCIKKEELDLSSVRAWSEEEMKEEAFRIVKEEPIEQHQDLSWTEEEEKPVSSKLNFPEARVVPERLGNIEVLSDHEVKLEIKDEPLDVLQEEKVIKDGSVKLKLDNQKKFPGHIFYGHRNAALEPRDRTPWVAPNDAEGSDVDVSPLDVDSDDDDPTHVPDECLTQEDTFDHPNARCCKCFFRISKVQCDTMARQGRNLSDFQILELLDASDNESEIDCIEAEVLYDSDLDKEYEPSHQEMIESSDSDSEEDLPRRRIETKAAGKKRKRPWHLPSTISPDNIATPSTGLATSTPGPSGYSVPLAIGDSDPHSSTAAPAAIPATAPAGTPATTPASPAATLPAVPAPTPATAPAGTPATTPASPAATLPAVPAPTPATAPAGTPATTPASPAATLLAVPAPTPATAPAAPRGQRRRRADDGELLVTFNSATVKSNSGYTWHTRPQVAAARRTPARNIVVSSRPGPTQAASQYTTPEECFDLFMSTAIVDLIVDFTNKKIDDVATKYKRKTATVQHTTAAEIRALLGVLIFSGYRKDNHLNTRELWCSEVGALFYKAAMSEVRFNFLLYCLRFDDMGTREQRRATDKFAPVREMWDMFMANCEDNYTPHENLTVDEQLLAFRGKCPFRMYIPNKPAKYGIKIVMVNDVQSKYLLKAIPYLGKAGTTTRHGLTLGHMFTKDLTSRYQNTNRNVTTDNWFTSVPLIQDLLTNGLTLVGTVRANKPEIPPVMREKKDRRPGSSAFLFTDDLTLVSYVPNTQTTKKNVLLLSSMHTQQVVNDVTGKPNIIEYYNETKGGVDTFDQMCATYNCSRKTNRWPLCVFFGMVNAIIINSWIIYKANNPTLQRKELHRRKFMHGLALQLIKPSAQERMNNPSQHRQVKLAIRQVCSLNLRSGTAADAGPSAAEMRNPMVRCTKCDSKADKKTRFRCHSCRQPVCPSHYFPYCCDCI